MGKALREWKNVSKLHGCDLHSYHAGRFIFDECHIVERASSQHYFERLDELLTTLKIDVLIPATEAELEVFLRHKPTFDCLVIKANDLSIETGLDKLRTAQFLQHNGIPCPVTHDVTEMFTPAFPCILKKRTGSGSKAVHIVRESRDFDLVVKLYADLIYQEYLKDGDEEYTCGLFRSKTGQVRTIVFKRRLTGGYSGYGEVVVHPAIEKVLRDVAESLSLEGSINVQLRLDKGVPKIFEINPRFSSTVLFRHLLGFTDLIWAINHAAGQEIGAYNPPKAGAKFYKGFQEYITLQ